MSSDILIGSILLYIYCVQAHDQFYHFFSLIHVNNILNVHVFSMLYYSISLSYTEFSHVKCKM